MREQFDGTAPILDGDHIDRCRFALHLPPNANAAQKDLPDLLVDEFDDRIGAMDNEANAIACDGECQKAFFTFMQFTSDHADIGTAVPYRVDAFLGAASDNLHPYPGMER